MLDFFINAQEESGLKQLIWATLVTLPCGAIAADIYRTVDADGRVIFTDRPADADNADEAAEDDEPDQPDRPFGAEVPRPATPEEIAAQRAENCEYAQQVAETYTVARRLFRDLGDGEREYLSADEIDQARSEAEQNVATWCD